MSRLTRDWTAVPVSRDQILVRDSGQENNHFPFSAYHEQYWQPYSVDPYSCYVCDHTVRTIDLVGSYETIFLVSKKKMLRCGL